MVTAILRAVDVAAARIFLATAEDPATGVPLISGSRARRYISGHRGSHWNADTNPETDAGRCEQRATRQ
jgi:hypothetical protein